MINKQSIIDSILESFNLAKQEIDDELIKLHSDIVNKMKDYFDNVSSKMSDKMKRRFRKLAKILLWIAYTLYGIGSLIIMIVLIPLVFLYSIGYIGMKNLNDLTRFILSRLTADVVV